jgi:hypothetical protein
MYPVHNSAIPLKGLREQTLSSTLDDSKYPMVSFGADSLYNTSVTSGPDNTKAGGKSNGLAKGEGLPSLVVGKNNSKQPSIDQVTPGEVTNAAGENKNSFRISNSKSTAFVGFQKKLMESQKVIGKNSEVREKNPRFEDRSEPTLSSEMLQALPVLKK